VIRFAAAPPTRDPKDEEADPSMANDDTLAQALASVRQQRETLETEFERVGGELSKLRLAERSLASIVDGTPMDNELADDQPRRRRASSGGDQPQASRGPRRPRANSAKGRLKTLLDEAGSEGLTHAEIAEHLTDVAASTLNTYLSMMVTSGELERHGDKYRAGAPAADAQDEDAAEDNPDDTERAETAQ